MLDSKKKIWIIKQKELGKLTDSEIASAQRITRRHVQRLWFNYKEEGLDFLREKPIGRRVDEIPKKIQDKILNLRHKDYGIRKIECLLKQEDVNISKRKITRILKENNLHIQQPEKGKRYNYIKWERKHSNSLWQTDFCWISQLDCWLTAWLDDHSRLIASAEYVTEATTDSSLEVFEKGVKKYGLPRETLSDRGTQYYPNLGETCRFLEYMKSLGVKHIYASMKKPTTCVKLERLWKTDNDERWSFNSLKEFVKNYNEERLHMSLDYNTPYYVWKRDLKV
mgnify:FL=1